MSVICHFRYKGEKYDNKKKKQFRLVERIRENEDEITVSKIRHSSGRYSIYS